MIRALVLDFDGLILDTERPVYEGYRWLFEQHGLDLPIETWAQTIGSREAWDPMDNLAASATVDQALVDAVPDRIRGLVETEAVLPGVVELLAEAKALGLPVGVASSSTSQWVVGNLDRLGLADEFQCVHCYREGEIEAKPAPDLYLAAVRSLGVEPHEAIAFEDSLNGVTAAKSAGLWCVAVPHGLTKHLDLSAADLIVESLADVALRDLVDQWGRPTRDSGA